MFKIMDYSIKEEIVKNKTQWFTAIGSQPNNEHNLKKGGANFTVEQIIEACTLTGHSADWVLGLSDIEFRYDESKSPLQRIKEAIKELENKK